MGSNGSFNYSLLELCETRCILEHRWCIFANRIKYFFFEHQPYETNHACRNILTWTSCVVVEWMSSGVHVTRDQPIGWGSFNIALTAVSYLLRTHIVRISNLKINSIVDYAFSLNFSREIHTILFSAAIDFTPFPIPSFSLYRFIRSSPSHQEIFCSHITLPIPSGFHSFQWKYTIPRISQLYHRIFPVKTHVR